MKELEKILEDIEHEHPYHIPGRPETYSEYNDGWTDAIDRVRAELSKKLEELKPYEDTGLTPEQIVSLKKRDTAKAPSYQDENFGYFVGYFECPNCGMAIYTSDDLESHHFCLNCGQRIKWKENIDGE